MINQINSNPISPRTDITDPSKNFNLKNIDDKKKGRGEKKKKKEKERGINVKIYDEDVPMHI